MDYIAQPKDYWIATNAINITRNALGKPNRIQCSVASGAAILCYIEGVDGLGYDNGHRFRTWPLTISPTYFNSDTEKYVYVAIPRSMSVGTRAVVVFPSEQLDIYGVNANDEQVGSADYYYIWLQGILTATDGTSNREWQQTIDFGKKGTDEDLYDDTSSDWYQYSRVSGLVTFLKNIRMKAGTTFQNLILGNKELTGVATSNTAYTDSDALVATPGYVESQYLSKTHESTAQEQVGFLKGLWVKAKNLFGIDANGNAKLNSVTSDDIHSDGYNDDNIGGEGYHVYKDANGQGHVCTDFLDVRLKARFTELEIRRLSYVNADQVQSMAASKVEKVLPIGADGNVLTGSYSSSAIIAYRCLAVADDGSTATKNGWKLGDQARCQTFNITAPGNYTDVTNRLYWRLVVRIGQCSADGVILDTESSSSSDSSDDGDSKVYHFFDLANIANPTCDPTTRTPNDGAEFAEFFRDTLTTGNAYHGYATQWTETTGSSNPVTVNSGNDAPAADDAVVQMGSQTDETRMGFFITKADGLNTGPYIYAGVNNFSLAGKMITKISPAEVLISARKLRVFVDPTAGSYEPLVIYRGDWEPGSTSYYYDEWDYQGSRWLCLYQGAEGTTEAPGTTPAYWKEISLKGDSVKIAGYAEYYYGDSSRPKPASPSVNGDVALLDYPDNSSYMIDVGVIDDMETLSGYWDHQNVPYGTCYIYRPNKHLYEATESGWRDLGKFNGDDGNGIVSVTRTYGISAQSTTASETTAPSDISSWASNSPAVTEAKPFLWAKEVVAYTKASTTTKYYCIGARGANGVDAQDIEWAYIRTKTNVAPVISNDSTYTDSKGKAFTDDDHLPKVVAGSGGELSDIEDDNSGNPAKKYECTDDPQGVTSEWKYEWEIKREKGNADSSGHRAWSAYSDKMTIHTMWAASPIIADLDNEMDSVACNTQGHPVQISGSNQVVSTNVSLMNGSMSVTPSSIVVRDTNSSGTQYGSGQTAQNGIKVTITGQKIDVEFTTSATIDGKKVFYIALTGTVNGASVTRELYFTVNGVRPGADGEPATLYNIIPSPNDIAFSRLASGGLNPDKQYLTFTVKKTVGDDITELLSGQMYNSDKLKLKYSTSAPPSSDYSDGTEWGSVEQGSKISFSLGTATIPNDVAFSCLYLALFKEVTENGSASYVLHDRETVTIVRDGAKGDNAQYIYLKGTARDASNEIQATINPEVSINGGSNLATNLRGLNLVTINRQTLALVESINYDTYGEAVSESGKTGLTDLYAKLNALDNSVFVCLVSHDAIGWNSNLITMLQSYGMGDLPYTDAGRYPFLFIGYKNLGKGNGLTRMRGTGNYYDVVELSAYVANGALTLKDGKDGTDGNTIRTVTVYKQSDTPPNAPSDGNDIPPSGWQSTPVFTSASGKLDGENVNYAFVKQRVRFKTTQTNQQITVTLRASSEENYDFIFCGAVDENVTSRPAFSSDEDDDENGCKAQYHATSGSATNMFTLTVATIGNHHIDIVYSKDVSANSGGDCGWWTVSGAVILSPLMIWASTAKFINNALDGHWSTPVRWNGEEGEDGYTISLTPSTIIINQSEELTTVGGVTDYFLDYTNAKALLEVKKGGVPVAAQITRSTDGHCSAPTINTISTGKYQIAITQVNKNSNDSYTDPTDNVTRTRFYDSGRITLIVTPNGAAATTLYLDFKCNLMGTIKTTIKGDVETTVAEKITYGYDNETGSVGSLQAVGKYIRSSEKNIAQLTETVGSTNYGNNLFGFSKGAIFDGAVPFVQGYGMACVWNNGQAYSRVWNLDFGGKPGYYVVTCEIKAQSEANIRFFLADIPPVDGVGLTNVGNELKVAVTTQWKKITAVYNLTAADIANSNGQLTIRDGSTSNHVFIRKLQIEHGSVPSEFGFCKEDEENISKPLNGITWSSTANSFTEATSGSEGPGGTSNYITNSYNGSVVHPASDSNIEVASSGIHVDGGIYTLSFWAKSNAVGNIMHCFCVDATNSQTYNGVMPNYITPYYGDIEPGQQEGMSKWGDVGIKLTAEWRKYYVHYYMMGPSDNMYIVPMRIIGNETGGQTGTYYIAQIKLEKGFVTSANRTEYQTVMRQTARAIDFAVMVNSMEKAGIHMYTESNGTPDNEAELAKGVIDLVAGQVNFVDPNGTANAKISIDPTTGTLTAVDGNFSGTMTAAGGAMYFGKDGSWTGMATVDSVVGGFADLVTVGMRNDGVGEEKTGRIVLQTAKKKDGVLRLSSRLKIENNGGTPGQSASGGNDGYKLTFTNILEASGKEDKIILDGGDGSGTFAGGVSAGTVEANYILAKAGYKIQTAGIQTVSSSGSISASNQMIIVNTSSDITLTLSSTGASAGQLMIIKKTTNSGWVTVKNSSGTQIGFFNCGSIVCVYNSGWK